MYEDSFGNYPFLVKKPISKVTGELYEIKRKELLDKIDDFEGAPDYYQRVKIKVKTHHGVNHAYAYIRENFDISEDQKPLKEWQNDMDYKVNKLNSLVDLTNLPTDEDNNHCIQIKPDQSLEDNGIEISIPITSQEGVKYYIKKILPLIKKYGYTNKDTGLHFHISIINKDGANFNFYLYMLMCHDKELLSSWQPRIGYSQNVMDILSSNTKALSRKIKNAKGTIWNLEKLKTDHKEQIKNSDKEKVAQFSSAVTEAGLLPE